MKAAIWEYIRIIHRLAYAIKYCPYGASPERATLPNIVRQGYETNGTNK